MKSTQQSSDHDLLITLNAKVDNLSIDMKQMGDGVSTKVSEHETRIRNIEAVHDKVDPQGSVKRINELERKVDRYLVIASAFGGAVVYVLSQLPNWLRLFNVKL